MKRATGYILGPNLFAQLLVIGSTPFLARMYTKADFAWFGVGTTVAVLLATLMSMRLEHSIHLEVSQASRVYTSCLMAIVFVAGFVLMPLVWFSNVNFIDNNKANSWYALLFAVGHAAHACIILFLNARLKFKSIALVNIAIPAVFVSGSLFYANLFEQVNGLLAWQSIAYALGALLGVALNARSMSAVSWQDFKRTLKTEKDSLRYLVPSSLVSTLTLNLPVLITTAFFSEAAAGLVVIAQRLARAPITVIGNGLNEVLRSTIPERSSIYPTFRRVAQISLLLSLCMLISTWVVPESVYLWLLGEQWVGLRLVLFATVFGAVFQLMGTSVMSLLSSFNKRQEFWVNILLLVFGLFAAVIAMLIDSSNLTYLWLHVLMSAVVFVLAFLLARKVALSNKPSSEAKPDAH